MQTILHCQAWTGAVTAGPAVCTVHVHPQSRATGIINLPAKPHLLFSTKSIYFPLLLPTSYFKPVLKSKILLQSQRCFLSTGLHSVSDCTGFYFTYLFHLLLFLWGNQPEQWRETTTETTRNREMVRKAAFSHPLSMSWCTLAGMCCQDPSWKSESKHSFHLLAISWFGAQVSSVLSPNLPVVYFLPLETQMERREKRNKLVLKKYFSRKPIPGSWQNSLVRVSIFSYFQK